MGLAELPSELQILIFSYLDRRSLKAVRGVSTKFRDNSSPQLFRSALACCRYLALSTLQKISKHVAYAAYVKEIVFDGSMYDQHIAKSEDLYHRLTIDLNTGFHWQKHQRYTRYRELYRDQEDIKNDGILFAEVSRALEWLRNVSTITYSPGPRQVPLESSAIRDLLPRGVSDTFAGPYVAAAQNGFHHLVGAIYEAQHTKIREFRVETVDPATPNAGTEFTLGFFDIQDVVHLEAGKYFFGHLSRLDMSLSLVDQQRRGWNSHPDKIMLQLRNLATLLAQAKNLEIMSFHICHWRPTAHSMYGNIVSLCENGRISPSLGLQSLWPKLRVLSLGGIYADEKELIDLMGRHKGTLTELNFTNCSLMLGSWANIVDEVLYNTKIMSFDLLRVNEIIGGVPPRPFGLLQPEEISQWQYHGRLSVNPEGQRYFDEGDHISVYAHRHQVQIVE